MKTLFGVHAQVSYYILYTVYCILYTIYYLLLYAICYILYAIYYILYAIYYDTCAWTPNKVFIHFLLVSVDASSSGELGGGFTDQWMALTSLTC